MDKKRFIGQLRTARIYILRGWVQDYYARDRGGRAVPAFDEAACSWCLMGALMRAGMEVGDWKLETLDGTRLSTHFWNDDLARTQTEVLACIDNSIAALQTRP